MRRKHPSPKALRLPLIDLGLAVRGVRQSAEWMDRVAVARALGVSRHWGGKIVKSLATRPTEYGPLAEREQVMELLLREIRTKSREGAGKREDAGARWERIAAARQRRKQRSLERIRMVVQLREKGWTWARIGKRLGVSRQRAHQMLGEALAGDRRKDRSIPITDPGAERRGWP